MAVGYNPSVPVSGLVWYLDPANRLSYPGTGVTASDINVTGTKFDATLFNGATFTSDGGGSFNCDGTNQYISAGNILNLTASDLSLAIWFKLQATSASVLGVFSKFGANGNYRIFLIDQIMYYQIRRTDNTIQNFQTSATANIPLGTWCHIAITHNYTTNVARAYLNGVPTTSPTATFTILRSDTTATFDLGVLFNNGTYTNCRISLPMVYNRVLTDSEILQMYLSTRGRFEL